MAEITVIEWRVVSAYTGAIAGRHRTEQDARGHADDLNSECRREGIKHLGEPMRYDVDGPVDVVDELATLEATRAELDELLRSARGGEKEAIAFQVEQLEARLETMQGGR